MKIILTNKQLNEAVQIISADSNLDAVAQSKIALANGVESVKAQVGDNEDLAANKDVNGQPKTFQVSVSDPNTLKGLPTTAHCLNITKESKTFTKKQIEEQRIANIKKNGKTYSKKQLDKILSK